MRNTQAMRAARSFRRACLLGGIVKLSPTDKITLSMPKLFPAPCSVNKAAHSFPDWSVKLDHVVNRSHQPDRRVRCR